MLVFKKAFPILLCLLFFGSGYGGEKYLAVQGKRLLFSLQPAVNAASGATADSWFSADKGLHFIGGMISTVGTGKSVQQFAKTERRKSLLIGAGFSFSLGLVKETHDALQPGNIFSYKDLLADCLGIIMGVILLRAH